MKGDIAFLKTDITWQSSKQGPYQANHNKRNPYDNKDFSESRQASGTSRLK